VSDPPYGVDYDPEWRNQHAGHGHAYMVARSHAIVPVSGDRQADWRPALKLFGGDVAYLWHGGLTAADAAAAIDAAGFALRAQIIWAKQHFVIGRGDYHWHHEPCWYAVRRGRTGGWHGGRDQSTLWEIANRSAFGGNVEDADTRHSTQKPVECMARPIRNSTKNGDAVYDPFLGSGTSLIAAEGLGRIAVGIDIEPAWVDVAVRRWQLYSGGAALLESSGEKFADREARVDAATVAAS
jgi:DNA modification methylase